MSQEKTLIAYKAFDKDLKCRGFQYEIGRTYEHSGKVIACESGFHAVENPLDMWSYYPLTESRFCTVELSGELERHSGDSKIASGRITVRAEIGLPQIITDAVHFLMGLCKDVKPGENAVQSASGDYSKLAASGYSSKLAASGYYSQLAASGYSSKLAASGDYSKLAASGYYSKLAASGDYSQLAASGKKSIVVSAAPGCTAKVGEDGCIALAWWDEANDRYRMAVGYVGEDGIEADVEYCVRDGKLAKAGDPDDEDE
jgi:hypothetical protein